jgi:TolB-like protein/DNA-binding winged helix-turn-helix (wHTH) protein/rhodanese-related sulfurtransferase/Flp pilus assembly protein TadD
MTPYQFDHFEILPAERRLLINGQSTPLGARAFDVLLALVERRDRTVTKNELLDLVWHGLVVEENNLQVQISTLRKILGQNAIATIPGHGYRFTLRDEDAEASSGPPNAGAGYRFTRAIGFADSTALGPYADAARAVTPSPTEPTGSTASDANRTEVPAAAVPAKPGFSRLWLRGTRRRGTAALTLTVLVLVLGGGIFWRYGLETAPDARSSMASTSKKLPDRPSLAVLPFDSLGGSSENSYFADGMTDDIITDLSKLSGILVVARNSSSTYKGKSVKVQQVGKELDVRYVLQGSVRREGDTVRINAQLVDALGGQHLWAERYDGSDRDVFALQDKVIRQIVAALAVNLTKDEQSRVGLVETQNPQAYDALQRGLAHYRQGSEDETNKALALFEQAIALDPGYARAHAAVAAASWQKAEALWESTTQGGYQRAFDRMQAALVKAMLQPNALAHAVSADFLSKKGRYKEAFTEIDKAMALAPNDPDNYLRKARILNATGRAAEAEESVRWGMRLEPLYSPEYLRVLAISLFHQQRYQEAVGTLERLLALKTNVADDYITLIASLGHLGRTSGIPEAITTFNELSVSAGYNTITVQGNGGSWWHGDLFNYDPAYRERLMEGLRKAGVPEGAGTDAPLEKVRRLLHKNVEGYYDVTGATTIDYKQAKTLHDRGVKFVDVRAAKDFANGHIPRAFNLDVWTELSRDTLSRIVGKDEEVVMSCHGKYCPDSVVASAKAVMWGFKRVYYFSNGFPGWQEAGYQIEVSPTK